MTTMNKKELKERELIKKDIIESLAKLADASAVLGHHLNSDEIPRDIIRMLPIGGRDLLTPVIDHYTEYSEIHVSTLNQFEMDSISNSPDSVNLLRGLAEEQLKSVKEMGLDDMLYSGDGYTPLRMVYERSGNYLYPRNMRKNDKDYQKRMELYREYSHKADELFRETLEDYYGTKDLPQKTKDSLYSKAWSDGHSSGYSEVRYHYDEIADIVKTMV